MTRVSEKIKRPYYINVPKGAFSPTGSIYKMFDIVKQGAALWSLMNGRLHRSSEPFTLRYQLPSGKIKVVDCKKEKGPITV